jgi:hypothetical protein
VDYVTDVIRCAIVFASVDEIDRFMEVRMCFSNRETALHLLEHWSMHLTHWYHAGASPLLLQEISKRNGSEPNSKPFEVVRVRAATHALVLNRRTQPPPRLPSTLSWAAHQVRNRLHPEFDSKHSSGECCARSRIDKRQAISHARVCTVQDTVTWL